MVAERPATSAEASSGRTTSRESKRSATASSRSATLLALGIRIPRRTTPTRQPGEYHIAFSYFARTDRALVMLNLVVLMLAAFLPSGSSTTSCGGTAPTERA